MNERIDEIAFEAGCHRHKYCNPRHPELDGYIISQAVLDKFAELIVRECIAMADEFEIEVNRSGLVDRMKEHFGVEE